ncbi:MAG TPA: sulfite exporter TauE/SafE family protein [Natronosporangium sp.]|nr:sulfite exporter TauE/SafE family protein [Natronosporangium sp.]
MTVTLAAIAALALLIGLSLGLLGGGGSILAVPLLVYVAGLPAREAIATSLLVVGVTSAVALIAHARAGRVRWRTGLWFAAASMVGAYAGGRLAAYIPDVWLLIGFAGMMLATAVAMLRGRRSATRAESSRRPVGWVLVEGAVVGWATGLVGAGGGFLVVPALVLRAGLTMPAAVATSLLVIALKSFAGLAGYLASVSLDWPLAWTVTAAAVAGSLLGARWAGRVPEATLRRGFGGFVLVMGAVVLAGQAPPAWWSTPAPWLGLGAAGLAVAGISGWVAYTRRGTVEGRRGESAPGP